MTKHDVIIVGGGPTGLMLAAELAIARVDVALVERRPDQQVVGTRAGGLHARTIELLEQRGVAGRFLAQGRTAQVAGFGYVPLDISDFPTRHPYGLALAQNEIERILAEWVAELPVTFLRGRDVTGFTEDEGGVDVRTSDGATLHARYLVGCDGGRSVVRKGAGIDFVGWDASTSYLIAEASAHDPTPNGMQFGLRGVNAVGRTGGDRIRAVLVEPDVRSDDEPTESDLKAALVAVYGTDFGVHDVTWISRFTDMARQAASYRRGRVLVAGDAAHVHSPAGGQGLNLGMHDAVNLGWKLAQVVHGTSPDALLDTYHHERHPIAARVLEDTLAQTALARGDDRTNALRKTMGELLAMDEPRRRFGARMSGLDVHYDLGSGHPLLGRRMPDLEVTTGDGMERVFTLLHDARPLLLDLGTDVDVTPWPERVRRVAARYEGPWELPVLGAVPPPAAVLVRPDGYVAWAGGRDGIGLREALARWFGSVV